jgi:hypothetical protein
MFLVINTWLRSLDLTLESSLGGPREPIIRIVGWEKGMESVVPGVRRLSTLGWILVAAGFAAQLPGALAK